MSLNTDIPKETSFSGFKLPVLGLGTWQMGGRHTHDLDNDDERDKSAIRLALNSGIAHIDTAEAYAAGYTEKLVGSVIPEYDRAKIILASKVSPQHLKYDDVLRAHESSLNRLCTDYLDLYLIHHPNPEIPLKETMRALAHLEDEGTIRAIGVSNFNVKRLEAAQHHCEAPISVIQAHYNLSVREAEISGLLKYCQEKSIIFTAWRPIEKGTILDNENEVVDQLCANHNISTSQLALAWLCEQKQVVTLVKTSNPAHLQENIAALETKLNTDEIELLRHEYKPQITLSPTFPLG